MKDFLSLDPKQVEAELDVIDKVKDEIGKRCALYSRLLYDASWKARIELLGDRRARCLCDWEYEMDELDGVEDKDTPLWARLSNRSADFEELAISLGYNPGLGDRKMLCNGEDCDCPYYDDEGEPYIGLS
jgi:hypothetical protein